MVKFDFRQRLPTSTELACSDDIPVDNEDQNFIPNVLLFLLNTIWAERHDWFFGVDMAIYHTTGINPRIPAVPDGFLSLGVERRKAGKSRKSYLVWEENEIVPSLVLEIVSWKPGGEYDEKQKIYAQLGVLYYIIYNSEFWQRDEHQPFEIYKLINGVYQLQIGEPYWMSEVGLGIGRHQITLGTVPQEVLAWYSQQGNRYLMPEEREQRERQRAEQESQRAEQEHQRAERLAARLRELGENPDQDV